MATTRRRRAQSRPGGGIPGHDHAGQILGVLVAVATLGGIAYEFGKSAGTSSCQQQNLSGEVAALRQRIAGRGL